MRIHLTQIWICFIVVLSGAVHATTPVVVTSIAPVHSLVSAVMAGVGSPQLLVTGANSPHHFALKPSQASALASADLVVWVGEDLERFLVKPMQTVAADAQSLPLSTVSGLTRYPYRDLAADRRLNSAHRHQHDEIDPHQWLDPVNAVIWVTAITEALSVLDPDHATTYQINSQRLITQIDAARVSIAARLVPLAQVPFVVFHDGYHYFEARFGLQAIAAITLTPESQPGVDRLRRIQETIREAGAVCVFTEPQFPKRLVETVTDGLDVRIGLLDPLGAATSESALSYLDLLEQMTMSFERCLGGKA